MRDLRPVVQLDHERRFFPGRNQPDLFSGWRREIDGEGRELGFLRLALNGGQNGDELFFRQKIKRRHCGLVAAKQRVRAAVSRLDDGDRIVGVPQELHLREHARDSAERRTEAIAVQHAASGAELSKQRPTLRERRLIARIVRRGREELRRKRRGSLGHETGRCDSPQGDHLVNTMQKDS